MSPMKMLRSLLLLLAAFSFTAPGFAQTAGDAAGIAGRINNLGPVLNARTIAVLGDSFNAANDSVNSGYGYNALPIGGPYTTFARRSSSMMAWFDFFSGGQYNYSLAQNFAHSGDTTTQMLARLPNIMASGAGVWVYLGGTNDWQLAGPQVTIANDQQVIAAAKAAGATLFIGGIAPRNAWTDAPGNAVQLQRRQWIAQVNAWRRAAAQIHPNVYYFDPPSYWMDPGAAVPYGPVPVSTRYRSDGLHPSDNDGGLMLGYALWQADLNAGATYMATASNDNSSTYDATNNVYGNRLANPMLQSSGGNAGTAATGIIPASWTVGRAAGTTGAIVGSLVARPDGLYGNVWQGVMTATSGAQNEEFQITQASLPAVVGETVAFRAQINATGLVNFRGIQMRVLFNGANGGSGISIYTFDAFGAGSTNTNSLPVSSIKGVLRTEPFVVPAGTTSVNVYIYAVIDGTGTGTTATLQVSDCFFGRVPIASELGTP